MIDRQHPDFRAGVPFEGAAEKGATGRSSPGKVLSSRFDGNRSISQSGRIGSERADVLIGRAERGDYATLITGTPARCSNSYKVAIVLRCPRVG